MFRQTYIFQNAELGAGIRCKCIGIYRQTQISQNAKLGAGVKACTNLELPQCYIRSRCEGLYMQRYISRNAELGAGVKASIGKINLPELPIQKNIDLPEI